MVFFGFFDAIRCYLSIMQLGFVFLDLDSYDKFFREESVAKLTQTGVYTGVDGIREYIAFGHPVSPFIDVGPIPLEESRSFSGYNAETGQCKFTSAFHRKFKNLASTTARETDFNVVFMINLYLDINESNLFNFFTNSWISNINLYYTQTFLNWYFGDVLVSDNTRSFICYLMEGPCAGVVSDPGPNCTETLEALPAAENTYVDGNSQGCRVLHSSLALNNPDLHCAHLSFDPVEDPNGAIKCQKSSNIQVQDLFSESDLEFFAGFATSLGYDPGVAYVQNEIE